MKQESAITDEVRALVADMLEQRLDAARKEQLAQLLLTNEAVRSYYVQMMQQHASLHWYLKAASSEQEKAEGKADRIGALQALAKIAEYERNKPVELQAADAEAMRLQPGKGRRARPWLRAAAMLLLAAGIALVFVLVAPSQDNPAEPVAAITRSHNAVWKGADGEFASFSTGTRLVPGDMELVDGEAELTFDAGAIVVVDAHEETASFRIDSRSQFSLRQGKITTRMKQGSQGVFTLNAPALRVTHQSAEFGLRIKPGGAGELHVFRGSVNTLATRAGDQARAKAVVAMNQAVQFEADGLSVQPVPVQTKAFAGHLRRDEQLLAPEQREDAVPVPPAPPAGALLTAVTSSTGSMPSIHAGLAAGNLVYTDRFHQWRDIPDALAGAEYARLTNNDRNREDCRITLTVSRPAVIYVLWNPNTPAQNWLMKDFRDTGVTIGVDRIDEPRAAPVLLLRYEIWRREVPAGTYELGPLSAIKSGLPGIVVVDAAKAGL